MPLMPLCDHPQVRSRRVNDGGLHQARTCNPHSRAAKCDARRGPSRYTPTQAQHFLRAGTLVAGLAVGEHLLDHLSRSHEPPVFMVGDASAGAARTTSGWRMITRAATCWTTTMRRCPSAFQRYGRSATDLDLRRAMTPRVAIGKCAPLRSQCIRAHRDHGADQIFWRTLIRASIEAARVYKASRGTVSDARAIPVGSSRVATPPLARSDEQRPPLHGSCRLVWSADPAEHYCPTRVDTIHEPRFGALFGTASGSVLRPGLCRLQTISRTGRHERGRQS